LRVFDAGEQANEVQKSVPMNVFCVRFGNELRNRRFAFKPNTKDMRATPSRVLIDASCSTGASISADNSAAMDETGRIYCDRPDLTPVKVPTDALDGTDVLLRATEWKAFRNANSETMKSLLKSPVVFDGRNLHDPAAMRAQGFEYFLIGQRT